MDVFVPPFNASILTWMHSAGPLWGDSNPKLLERPRGAQTFCHLYEVWSEWKSLAPFWDLSTCFTHSFFFAIKNLTWLFHLAKTGPSAAANHWPWPSSSCYEETENYKRCGENSWKPRRFSAVGDGRRNREFCVSSQLNVDVFHLFFQERKWSHRPPNLLLRKR